MSAYANRLALKKNFLCRHCYCYRSFFIFCLASFAFASFVVVAGSKFVSSNHQELTLKGYLPEYRAKKMTKSSVNALCARVDAIVLFSLEVDQELIGLRERGRFFDDADDDKMSFLKNLREAKKRFDCDVHMTIGGSSRSKGFSEVTKTKQKRVRFTKSIVQFLNQYEDVVDGIDLNWSFPESEDEWRNFGAFVKQLKKGMKELSSSSSSKKNKKKREVSVAYYPNENQEQILEMLEVSEFADGLHAMAYDSDDKEGHSTIDHAMKALNYAQNSFTGGKIMLLGLPFYGRSIPENPTGANPPMSSTYRDIMKKNDYTLRDEDNRAMTKVDEENDVEVWFNNKDLIREKVQLCRTYEDVCKGIFVWELGQDLSLSTEEEEEEEEKEKKDQHNRRRFHTREDRIERRELSLLSTLARAAWGDVRYERMLEKEMKYAEEDLKNKVESPGHDHFHADDGFFHNEEGDFLGHKHDDEYYNFDKHTEL